jgi:hypothetical protein
MLVKKLAISAFSKISYAGQNRYFTDFFVLFPNSDLLGAPRGVHK